MGKLKTGIGSKRGKNYIPKDSKKIAGKREREEVKSPFCSHTAYKEKNIYIVGVVEFICVIFSELSLEIAAILLFCTLN